MVDDNVTHASKLTSFVNKHLRKGPSEPFFDDIVDLAIQLYRAPMAVVAFANETGYWFKAQRGLHIQAIDNTAHLLARTLGADAPLVVANNMRDDAAATDPLLIAVGARFFVGVPLVAVDGVPIGALAVMDRIARCGSTEDEHGGLTILARRVVGEVEQRYRSADQESKHEERFRFIADNVPAAFDCTTIQLIANFLVIPKGSAVPTPSNRSIRKTAHECARFLIERLSRARARARSSVLCWWTRAFATWNRKASRS